jgi:hypothetical protein
MTTVLGDEDGAATGWTLPESEKARHEEQHGQIAGHMA